MKTKIREENEWLTMRWHDEVTSSLPRLLLVGDSITNGHATLLNEKLNGQYSVDALTTSKIVSDHEYMSDLQGMFAKHKYKIIIFNNGLHGIDVDDNDYALELFNVLSELKSYTGNLIWRNSTPCYKYPDGRDNLWTEKVQIRNKLADIEVRKLGIPVIDCYSVLADRPELVSDGVHFHTAGYQVIVDVIYDYFESCGLLNIGR
jgi:hypothetical protein